MDTANLFWGSGAESSERIVFENVAGTGVARLGGCQNHQILLHSISWETQLSCGAQGMEAGRNSATWRD
jgi:hypothetical protein